MPQAPRQSLPTTGTRASPAAHTLGITTGEWTLKGHFYSVTEEFNLPTSDVEDLQVLLLSMRDDCLAEGTAADAHPAGPTATKMGGSFWFGSASLYERLGGLYPIALFVDRLIDALLADPRVAIPVDGHRRNEASMKYLFTEVVCAIVGGPEHVTSLAYAEARLLLPARQMFFLLEAAKDASDHFHSSKLRAELLQALHQAAADYIVDQRTTSPPSQRHSERAEKIEALSAQAGVPLNYIPKGGVVRITFDASSQLEQVAAGLADMGLKRRPDQGQDGFRRRQWHQLAASRRAQPPALCRPTPLLAIHHPVRPHRRCVWAGNAG